MEFPVIMESNLRYIWMIAPETGYVIYEKESVPIKYRFNPGHYAENWAQDRFWKCEKKLGIELKLITLILLGKIKRIDYVNRT